MTKMHSLALAGILAATPLMSSAIPLSLDYAINSLGAGQYRYDFTLTLDNNDGSWAPGMQFDWIVFGNRKGSYQADSGFCPSGCSAAAVQAATSGLDAGFTANASGGGHQGPMIQFGSGPTLPGWAPSLGDFTDWSYTSDIYLPAGELYFGVVISAGGSGYGSSFFLANDLNAPAAPAAAVPEPGALSLAGLALAGLAAARRRRV